MALEEKIAEWAAGRSNWQRVILRRMADRDPPTEEEYDKLVEDLLGSGVSPVEVGVEHLPKTETDGPQVKLVSLSDPEHVNAIASPKAPMTFGDTGLTVVYGDNGSGKSGYARILKKVARARHQEPVLTDVFEDTSEVESAATLNANIGGAESELSWPEDDPPELRNMLFYDGFCGDEYIDKDSAFPYSPAALYVMKGLIDACGEVSNRVEAKIDENRSTKKALPDVPPECEDTDAAMYISELSGKSSTDGLDALIENCDAKRIEELKEREKSLTKEDPSEERKRLNRDAEKLRAVANHVVGLEQHLGTGAVAALVGNLEKARRLTEDAAKLALQFKDEPLSGVGSESWQNLWDSARTFSEEHAYAEESYPFTDDGACCVLCHQKLEDDAKERLTRFENFVSDDTKKSLEAVLKLVTVGMNNVRKCDCFPEWIDGHLKDLSSDQASLIAEVKTLLQKYKDIKATLKETITAAGVPENELDPAGTTKRLRAAATTAQETAENLETPEGIEEELSRVATERSELELLEAIKTSKKDILFEIERRAEMATLEAVKREAATGPISTKIKTLSEEEVSAAVHAAFITETAGLQLKRISLTKPQAEKGSLVQRPRLVQTKQSATPREVFSEGEKTALGLAAFFTEAELDGSKSALIFDDPVSSLDHIRTGLVAARLSSFAKTRQVVVFTHSKPFVHDLRLEARRRSVNFEERSVSRDIRDDQPGKCAKKLPWNLREVGDRLNDLEVRLAALKKCETQEEYDDGVSAWAARLSQTWEAIFRTSLVGRVLSSGGTVVQTKMVKLLVEFDEKDNDEFQASFGKLSGWTRHEQSAETEYTPPKVEELEAELAHVKQWFKRVNGRS